MAARRDNLTLYRKKRDFTRTPEPEGVAAAKEGRRYLIQKHAATRLHYDFRLELDGVLKSWAVTRGPSLDPQDKRLAVEVEDHPVAYGSFEGIIPKGQYGGGTVMLWDEGEWEPIGDPKKGLAKGKLEFRLYGKRLHGEWTLVRMKSRPQDKGRHNWLLIKHKDEEAREGDKDSFLARNDTSITSGRNMEDIADSKDRVWKSKAASAKSPKTGKAEKSKLPAFLAPQLATLTDALPKGEDWVHEIKFDGYRALAYIEGGKPRLYTRSGQDWTEKFAPIPQLLKHIKLDSAILDGEIVALNDKQVSSFSRLQEAMSEGGGELQYYVFDLLYLNGEDLRALPLLERKARLQKLLKKPIENRIIYCEHFPADDPRFMERICDMQLEGIISKQKDAPYRSGRGGSWLKTKCHKRQEFVIGGFTLPTHEERGIGALLLGYYEEEQLRYAGKVGTGFNQEMSMKLRKALDKLPMKTCPFETITSAGKRGAHWVNPKLVCEVEFTEWTKDGHLRHPSFQGLREDKPAQAVERDRAKPVKTAKAAKTTAQSTIPKTSLKTGHALVAGIAISHPERLIYPGTSITKLDLAEYYEAGAPYLLPHISGRPISMLRCPEGEGEECFFQRHIASGQSAYLYDTGVKVKGRSESYVMIKDVQGLISLVQWGVIELHAWGCHADKPDLADQMVFDLDPDPAVAWDKVIDGAREIKERMREFGLESFVKTTGGKGLHVVVPIRRRFGWPVIKAFARAIAESMQQDAPQLYIAKASKAARKGKIFVDYLRNDLTSTAIAPYSARAREGAPVSMPVAWSALKASLNPRDFNVETAPGLLAKRKADPWDDFFKIKQGLSSKYLRALKIDPG